MVAAGTPFMTSPAPLRCRGGMQVLPPNVELGCFGDARVWVGGEPAQGRPRDVALYVLHNVSGLVGAVPVRAGLFCGADLAAATAAVNGATASMTDFKFVVGAMSWVVRDGVEVDIGDTWFKADGEGVVPVALLGGLASAGTTNEADSAFTRWQRGAALTARICTGVRSAGLPGRSVGARDAVHGRGVRGAGQRAVGLYWDAVVRTRGRRGGGRHMSTLLRMQCRGGVAAGIARRQSNTSGCAGRAPTASLRTRKSVNV